ncbi:unannotated protein [freshwater metagenome]|uniref:Unannotated protein n=1 Tax=freshwater metagenome TaxID=449393 RepID=A0A6J6EIP7_9ZZZZ
MEPRVLGCDFCNGVDCFNRIAAGFFLASCNGEGQGVDDDVLNPQTPLIHQRVNQLAGDADFVHRCSRLALFINSERDHRRPVFLDQGHDCGEA